MIKELWINLPVKDVGKAKAFWEKLGFSFDGKEGNSDESARLVIGEKKMNVMLFAEATFKSFTKNEIPAGGQTTEVLLSIDAESRAEVDEMAGKVSAAGGTIFSEPEEIQGWMYGFGFADLDGHRWNTVNMNFGKMPREQKTNLD